MAYVYAGIAILVLFLIGRIIRWWNLPEVAKARTERVKARQEQRTRRVMIRRGTLKPENLSNLANEPGKVVEAEDPPLKRRRWFFWRREECVKLKTVAECAVERKLNQ